MDKTELRRRIPEEFRRKGPELPTTHARTPHRTTEGFAMARSIVGLLVGIGLVFPGIELLRWLADVSYPLYVVHLMVGWVLILGLVGAGLPLLLAQLIAIASTLLLAWVLHVGVEAPSHRVGQRLVSPGGWSVERARWRDYTGPVLLVRADLVPDTVPDLRVAALAAASRSGTVIHVPEVLYRCEWREREIDPGQRTMAVDQRLIDISRIQIAGFQLVANPPHGLNHVPLAAIGDSQHERHARICGSTGLRIRHALAQDGRQAVTRADEAQLDAILVQGINLALQHFDEQPHERIDFTRRALPVLAAEGK